MSRIKVVLAVSWLAVCGAIGGVPELISHQGKLLDVGGDAVSDGTYLIEFRFYDACTGGDLLLIDAHSVEIANGIYSVLLGGGTLTRGSESSLIDVFAGRETVCLGTTVGTDSEMVPRQPIASAGYALRAATADALDTAVIKQANGVYYCGADWDDNGVAGENGDVIACLESALAVLTTNEDGDDNSITARLPDGTFDVSSACDGGSCFELKSGIHIVGEMPRLRYVDGQAPDLDMQANGGSWLDPGAANTLFTGRHLRGVTLESFGVTNFGSVARFGDDGEDGISFSTIRDVYAVGTHRLADPRSTVAWTLYNIQHVRMDHVKVYNAERGLHVIGQKTEWQPANSVITDFYAFVYRNPPGGILLETLKPSDGDAVMMNYMTFIRPQVNAFGSTGQPGSAGILLRGHDAESPVQMMSFVGADLEGGYESAVRLEQADHNWIQIAALPSSVTGVSIDAGSEFNTIASLHDRVKIDVEAQTHNLFIGHFDSVDATLMNGLVWDRTETHWTSALGSGGRLSSGPGYLWYDTGSSRWRSKEGAPTSLADGQPVVTGTGASASQGPVLWTDAGISCSAACSGAGMAGCVDAWAGAASVGCASGTSRRICACR